MNIRLVFSTLIIGLFFGNCGIIRKTPKTEFKDGFYTQKINGVKRKVYIDKEDDSLRIHQTKIHRKDILVDTTAAVEVLAKQRKTCQSLETLFNKNGLDIDFLIMPLKYRPSTKGLPAQLNGTLNGSVFIGYRTDKYFVSYELNPLNKYDRIINHYGASFGFFGGFGNSVITPTTTNYILISEYDGVVFSKGIAGTVAVNNFTVGLAFGFDNLLDRNSKYWIYESKPWLGLALGLNLN